MQILLDLRSVVFCSVVTQIICTLVITGLWRQNRKHFDGVGHWAAELGMQTAGFLLLIMRGYVPDFVSITVAHMFLLGGTFVGYLGLERFLDRRGFHGHIYLLLCAYPFFSLYFTYASPNLWLRSLVITLALCLLALQALWLLLYKTPAATRSLTRWFTLAIGAYAVVFFLRGVMHLTHPFENMDYFNTGQIDIIWFALFQMLSIFLTYAAALMLNKSLHLQVQARDRQFFDAFHYAPYAIFMSRLSDGAIHAVNQAFFSLWGYGPQEVLGSTMQQLGLWERIEEREDFVREVREKGLAFEREAVFRKKSGETFTGLLSGVALDIRGQASMLCSINDITGRKRALEERERLLEEQRKALSEIKILSGMLPICASCKKIRDDQGYWSQIESYIRTHSEAEFNHSLCPECAHKLYPEFLDKKP